MKIHTIIVNYRTPESTVQSIEAAASGMRGVDDWQISVVDNASGDGSYEKIRDAVAKLEFADRVSVIASERNGGFAAGNNLVLAESLASDEAADFYYLCNPDSYVDPGAITGLANYLEQHPDAGIAGGQLCDEAGNNWSSAFRFHSLLGELDWGLRLGVVSFLLRRWRVDLPASLEAGPVDWVCGASMMIRREVFNDIGLLDENYFLYYEETDFCRCAKNAGWSTHHVPECRAHHICGLSIDIDEPQARRPNWWFESRRYYFLKHHGLLYTMGANMAFFTGMLVWRAGRLMLRRPNTDPANMLTDFIRHNFRITRGNKQQRTAGATC